MCKVKYDKEQTNVAQKYIEYQRDLSQTCEVGLLDLSWWSIHQCTQTSKLCCMPGMYIIL